MISETANSFPNSQAEIYVEVKDLQRRVKICWYTPILITMYRPIIVTICKKRFKKNSQEKRNCVNFIYLCIISHLFSSSHKYPSGLLHAYNNRKIDNTTHVRVASITQRPSILYRISALVWRSVTGCAPSYLTDLCRPVSDLHVASRRALCSSAHGELLVPRARSALKQRRAFSVIGPSTWNELPLTLRLLPQNNMPSFCKLLKTFLFDRSWTESASE